MSETEIEDTLKRIQSHRGVKGVLIINNDGIPIRTNMNSEDSENYCSMLSQLVQKATSVVRTLDNNDDLTFLRVRSKQHEILIAPDKEYVLIVVQNPNME